jgi:hypothetical protein
MRPWLLQSLSVLLLPTLSLAFDYACGDNTAATTAGTQFRVYLQAKDPAQVVSEVDCHTVPKESVDAQRAFLLSPNDSGRPRVSDPRKLRVVDGLVVDKVAGDITAINTADAAAAAAAAAEATKLTTAANDPFCKGQSLDNIQATIETARTTASTQITNARASAHASIAALPASPSGAQLKAMGDGLVDRLYDGLDDVKTRVYDGFNKTASCLYAKQPLQ